jgi:pyrroloquinoline quinone biosynthesis protein D
VKLAPGIRLRHDKARDRWVLLGPERGYVLNATGVALVQAMARDDLPRTMDELADGDATRYAQMEAFLDELTKKQLLA